MFVLFSRSLFFLTFLFSFLFLLPSAAQSQCGNLNTVGTPDVSAYREDGGPWMYILWGRVRLDSEVSRYIVRWGTSESTASEVDTGRANAYILGKNSGEDLDWDTTYKVWIGAERRGEVCWSEAAEEKTPSSSPPPSEPLPPTTPGAPGKPTVTGGNQEVTLTASVSDDGGSPVARWQYQQKADGGSYGSWTQISSSSSGNSLSGSVTGLRNGTTYRFKVRAVNAEGESAESPESDAVTPICPVYSPAVTAQDVEDPETLAAFVKEARTGIGALLSNTVSEEEGIRNLVECFGADGDWRHGSVHLFMISADEDRKFFLAPRDSELAGTLLDIQDENGCDVGEEILRAARGEELQCDDLGLAGDDPGPGFVQYMWRDPEDPDSEDYDSPRLSYVKEIRFESFLPSRTFVLGSGYYPEISEPGDETSGSGGGCALVAETGTRDGAGVGLFLSALAVGCAVFLGRGVFPRRG